MSGATALYAFGSLAEGKEDAFSDVDLIVVSNDLEASLAARHGVLSRVAPLSLEWEIAPSRDAWAATYLFAGISLYHKLDLGFVASGDVVDGVQMWRHHSSHSAQSEGRSMGVPYAPAPGTVEHVVTGHLLGVTRYVKARRRGNDLLCWRFASALLDATLALLYAKSCQKSILDRRLTTTEYLELDARLDPAVRSRMLSRMQLAPAAAMDRSVRLLVTDMLQTSADLGASIPDSLTAQLMAFFDAELDPN